MGIRLDFREVCFLLAGHGRVGAGELRLAGESGFVKGGGGRIGSMHVATHADAAAAAATAASVYGCHGLDYLLGDAPSVWGRVKG